MVDMSSVFRKIRIRGVWVLLLIGLCSAHHEMCAAGIAIATIGLLIRIWASGHISKDATLTISGPYAYTRNPLYLGSLLIGLGLCITISNYFMLAVVFILFTLVYYPTIAAEENKLLPKYGKDYQKYLNTVPKLLPSFKSKYPAKEIFSWKKFILNREYNAILAFISILIVFDLMEDFVFPLLMNSKISMLNPWLKFIISF